MQPHLNTIKKKYINLASFSIYRISFTNCYALSSWKYIKNAQRRKEIGDQKKKEKNEINSSNSSCLAIECTQFLLTIQKAKHQWRGQMFIKFFYFCYPTSSLQVPNYSQRYSDFHPSLFFVSSPSYPSVRNHV